MYVTIFVFTFSPANLLTIVLFYARLCFYLFNFVWCFMLSQISKEAFPCVLHALPVDRYLDRLEESNFDVLNDNLCGKQGSGMEPLIMMGRLVQASFKGKLE